MYRIPKRTLLLWSYRCSDYLQVRHSFALSVTFALCDCLKLVPGIPMERIGGKQTSPSEKIKVLLFRGCPALASKHLAILQLVKESPITDVECASSFNSVPTVRLEHLDDDLPLEIPHH